MKIGLHFNYTERGPGKVVSNLIKGLEINNIEYVINSDGDYNLILQNCHRLRGDLTNCIIGPNVCILPIDNKVVMDQKYKKMLTPSKWVLDKYSRWIPNDKLLSWAVGIDTDYFVDMSMDEKTNDFLIYFKSRKHSEVQLIVDFLTKRGKTFDIVEYGSYSEETFRHKISNSKFGFIIDDTESQGIAIEEMMSCNLPLMVWDVTEWTYRGEEHKVPATSIPYWDENCGESFTDINELEEKFNKLMTGDYNPRSYILDNLTLSKSSMEIVNHLTKNK